MHPMKQKMKRGTHTIQMKLPQSVRTPRGRPGQPDAQPSAAAGSDHVKRAILLSRDETP